MKPFPGNRNKNKIFFSSFPRFSCSGLNINTELLKNIFIKIYTELSRNFFSEMYLGKHMELLKEYLFKNLFKKHI